MTEGTDRTHSVRPHIVQCQVTTTVEVPVLVSSQGELVSQLSQPQDFRPHPSPLVCPTLGVQFRTQLPVASN